MCNERISLQRDRDQKERRWRWPVAVPAHMGRTAVLTPLVQHLTGKAELGKRLGKAEEEEEGVCFSVGQRS